MQPGLGHRNGLARSKDEAGRERVDEDATELCREERSPIEEALPVGVVGEGARDVWGVLWLLRRAGGRQVFALLIWRECIADLPGLTLLSLEVMVPGSIALNSVYSA